MVRTCPNTDFWVTVWDHVYSQEKKVVPRPGDPWTYEWCITDTTLPNVPSGWNEAALNPVPGVGQVPPDIDRRDLTYNCHGSDLFGGLPPEDLPSGPLPSPLPPGGGSPAPSGPGVGVFVPSPSLQFLLGASGFFTRHNCGSGEWCHAGDIVCVYVAPYEDLGPGVAGPVQPDYGKAVLIHSCTCNGDGTFDSKNGSAPHRRLDWAGAIGVYVGPMIGYHTYVVCYKGRS